MASHPIAVRCVAHDIRCFENSGGAPEIFAVSQLSLGEAAEHSSISFKTVVGLAADRKLTLYARVKVQPGHLTSVENFELADPARGSSGG